ncbi:hypothetical protein DFQ28_010649 [Apophysomyces sp. BC1034]|nr:hypothetical protein DFQ30_010233 [Apophysomyces sp. BC1015]KAG0170852.1 hypothetical protein DFQ29_009098 [Apophysomyces sp. BC1021]KAG0184726.1 hypothetical protein DFQ28_010649 [Apophysomyces sp. BC1034]
MSISSHIVPDDQSTKLIDRSESDVNSPPPHNKRKQDLTNDSAIPSTDILDAKRLRSESIDSQASWFQRLTFTQNNGVETKKIENDTQRSEDGNGVNGGGEGSGGDDDDDDGGDEDCENRKRSEETSNANSPHTPGTAAAAASDSSPGGLWYWLGYPSTSHSELTGSRKPADNDSSVSKSYWKYIFSNNSGNNSDSAPVNEKDSVIIDPSPSVTTEGVQQQNEQIKQSEAPGSEQPMIPPADLIKSVERKNAVLPTFQSQFSPSPPSPSTTLLTKALQTINAMFTQAKPDQNDPGRRRRQSNARFINEMKADPKTIGGKKIVVVGVHGWFPMKLVRSMVGEPTGTSTRFCDQMAAAAKRYFQTEHDLMIPDEAITIIPLQGEGKVEERVTKLFNSLLNNPAWVGALTTADIVLWATHSQGTPVSAILLHRLLDRGFIHRDRQSVCLLAMAGIAHGPFPSLKGNLIVRYFEADAARELFEFMDSNSDISQKYRQSLSFILRNDVKTILVGSMQDQVVPLYSAIMSGITHPNILRAIYIDEHIYSPDDFLINLITFALRLRNAGFSDHGLLTHISEVLAGNLYAWEGGHSTIYEELDVYMIAMRYLFETEPFGKLALISHAATPTAEPDEARLESFQARVRLNPFYLPWAMRGICDDTMVLQDQVFSAELEKLLVLFDRWNPTSARLRDIKFRLEPFKARL